MLTIHFVKQYSFAHFCNGIAAKIFIVHFTEASTGITKSKIRAGMHTDFQQVMYDSTKHGVIKLQIK